MAAGRSIEGHLDSADDIDYFAFTLTEISEIALTVTGDVDVALLDGDGNVIAETGSGISAVFSNSVVSGSPAGLASKSSRSGLDAVLTSSVVSASPDVVGARGFSCESLVTVGDGTINGIVAAREVFHKSKS